VVGEGFGRVFLAQEGHEGEEFEKGAGPAVEEGDGNGIGVFGEECGEVHVELAAIVVCNGGVESGEGVDVLFFFAPKKVLEGSVVRVV
jgi:hypothetical protein